MNSQFAIWLSQYAIGFIMLVVATITDLKNSKIPNWLTAPCFIMGICYTHYLSLGATKELCIFLVVFFVLGCMGVAGWGDIKCTMALAALTGWLTATCAFVFANILVFTRYLVLSPKSATKDFFDGAKQLLTARTKIDNTQKQHRFAPFLLGGYTLSIITLLIIFLIWR